MSFSEFEQWVQDNWSVKLDILKGDYGGDPNNDPTVGNYAKFPALLYDEFDAQFYFRDESSWVKLAGGVSIEGEELDETPLSVSEVSKLSFDSGTGLYVEDLGGGEVEVSIGSHYKWITVEGSSDLVAEGQDTLNFIGGSGIILTTDPSEDKITFEVDPSILSGGTGAVSESSLETVEPLVVRPSYPINSLGSEFYVPDTSSPEENGAIRIIDKGQVKASSSDKGTNTLDQKLEGDIYVGKTDLSDEEEELRIVDKGQVKASPSDRGTGTLFEKIKTGRGLQKYSNKAGVLLEEEELGLHIDDELLSVLDNLKYEEYAKGTEESRSNDVYVNSAADPYKSVRDGTPDRPYLTIKEALESERVKRGNCTVWVKSGIYIEEAPLILPPKTSVIGSELRRCRIYASTDTCGATYDRYGGGTYLFEVTHDCIIRNFTTRGLIEPGFTLGFVKDADLKTVSPYIQNVTSYNDGRDAHQIFQLEVTKVEPQLLPQRVVVDTVTFEDNIRIIERDKRHPDYDDEDLVPSKTVEIDGQVPGTIKLAVGYRYRFVSNNQDIIRFTSDLNTFSQSDLSENESSGGTDLDLTEVKLNDIKQDLYYQVKNEDAVDGKVEFYDPNLVYDDYVFRPGDEIKEIEVEEMPLNLERGDQIYIGDEGAVPFTRLRSQVNGEEEFFSFEIEPSKVNLEQGSLLYLSDGKGKVSTMRISQAISVDDTILQVEDPFIVREPGDPLIPFYSKYSFVQGSTIHYQHPKFAEKFVVVEDVRKGDTKIKVGNFEKIAESDYIAYELEERTKDPDNDTIDLIQSRTNISETLPAGTELWFEEIRNDRQTDNQFMVRLKEKVDPPNPIDMKVTNAYCKKSLLNDIIHVKRLNPQLKDNPEDGIEDHDSGDLHICQSYIRPLSSVYKDPWARRNGGGGAHVDGFRLDPRTRLSFDQPKSRSMQLNDYTQVNLNGYGVLCEGIANAECVSVFTYFTNNGLYSLNGGEIRALNCSSGFGVYGVKAEGYLGEFPDRTRTPENTPEITAERIWVGYTYTPALQANNQDPKAPFQEEEYDEAGESVDDDLVINNYCVIENPRYNPTQEVVRSDPKVGSLIRLIGTNEDIPQEIQTVDRFVVNDKVYIKLFVSPGWDTPGVSSPSVREPFGNLDQFYEDQDPGGDVNGIYEFRSVVRMTSHDFGYIGTGTRLPRNVGGSGTQVPENVAKRINYGQVFYSASDEAGNFLVGQFFTVEQATGKVSFSTDQFDLTNISELGPFTTNLGTVGVSVNEISPNINLSSDRPEIAVGEPGPNTVPTQEAVKTYVDQRAGPVIQVEVGYTQEFEVSINGRGFGSLQVLRGMTYRFNLVALNPGFSISEFWIVDKDNVPLGEDDGVFNNGSDDLTNVDGVSVLFTVPFDADPVLYYRLGSTTILQPESGFSTLYVRNPDIRFPQGSEEDPLSNVGSVQYYDLNEAGEPVFAGNSGLKVFGSEIQGIFRGTFIGNGLFLDDVPFDAGFTELNDVDLGTEGPFKDETIAFFPGTEEDPGAEWRRAEAYLRVNLNVSFPGDNIKSIPIRYNYKEGTPELDYIYGTVDFNFVQASYLIGVI